MIVTIKDISVADSTLDKALEIWIDVQYFYGYEIPVLISGRLSIDRKTISIFNDLHLSSSSTLNLQMKNQVQKNQSFASGGLPNNHGEKLIAFLSPKAIEFIEESQRRTINQSVIFNCEIVVKYFEMPVIPENRRTIDLGDIRLDFASKLLSLTHPISHSDWVNKFTQKLGIGNFILFEYSIPKKESVSEDWIELYERLYERTQEMEQAIRKGEWKHVMVAARQFYENIKIGDGKPNHKPFEEKLKALFLNEDHSHEGFQHLMDGIYNFFEFASKYIHDKDKGQKIQATPNYTKEDSYFIYSLSIGLLNMVAKKISVNAL